MKGSAGGFCDSSSASPFASLPEQKNIEDYLFKKTTGSAPDRARLWIPSAFSRVFWTEQEEPAS